MKVTLENKIRKIIILFQYPIFKLFYFLFLPFLRKENRIVIGTCEIAKNIFYLGKVIPKSYTVNLRKNRFYNEKYDFGPYNIISLLFLSPILLAYLIHKCDIFIYIWKEGFLINREKEFKVLKNKGKKIVTIYCGNDIRSLLKMKEYYQEQDMDSFVNYEEYVDDIEYDKEKKHIALITDKYADLIFNDDRPFSQPSYIKSKTYAWPYIIDIDKHRFVFDKSRISSPNIVHAPSDPIIKGTPLVRAAIKKLKLEGYSFNYIELINKPNELVLESLCSSHIVLNQFYACGHGLFGIEAMAHGNAVLMSTLNPFNQFDKLSKDAWLVTYYWEIYDKLKWLLDNPDHIEIFAVKGREFVEANFTIEKVFEYYKTMFLKHGICSL